MLKIIGNTPILAKHKASCHCGAVAFEIDLPEGLPELFRCNCSMCRRKGAIMAAVPLASITILQGQDALTLYQFNTRTAKHYFCSRCGIYTHHQRRSNPQQYAFNVACLEGVTPLEVSDVRVSDGIHHSRDQT